MEIMATLHPDHTRMSDEIDGVVAELTSAGIGVTRGGVDLRQPSPGLGIAGPASDVLIRIDPETLRQIFEFVTAFVVAFKGGDLVKEIAKAFLEALAKKLGEGTGGAILAGLRRLWRRGYDLSRDLRQQRLHAKANFTLEMRIHDVQVDVSNTVNPDRVDEISDADSDYAFVLLFAVVLPKTRELIGDALKQGAVQGPVLVTLALPVRNLDRFPPDEVKWRADVWHWHVRMPSDREFIITRDGQLRWRR